ncbi:hypothetical protein H4R21_006631, partial [Coemansia helicoidea]
TFFKEAFLYFTTRQRRDANTDTMEARALIERHVEGYMHKARIAPVDFINASQVAMYEAGRIVTAYTNNVSIHYGDNLRAAVNLLLNVPARRAELREAMKDSSQAEVAAAIREQITGPAALAKRAVMRGKSTLDGVDPETCEALAPLRAVLATYSDDSTFVQDDIEADSHKHPEKHLRAFYALAGLLLKHRPRTPQGGPPSIPQCFPLRQGWVPAHTHVDKQVLCNNILRQPGLKYKPFEQSWSQVVNLEHRALRPSGGRAFKGSVETDGVAVSVIKKTDKAASVYKGRQKLAEGQVAKPKPRNRNVRKSSRKDDGTKAAPRRGEIPYIHEVAREEVRAPNKLLLDPGRKDAVHGVHERSTPDEPERFRLTQRQINVQRRAPRFRKIRAK